MEGASQRWDRVAMVHFQCCSDLAGEAVSGAESSQGRVFVILKVIVKVLPVLEIL